MALTFNPFTGTFDFTGGGGGGGTIGGSIAATQVAFGTAPNTIGGSNNFTWDGTTLFLGTVPTDPNTADLIVRTGSSESDFFGLNGYVIGAFGFTGSFAAPAALTDTTEILLISAFGRNAGGTWNDPSGITFYADGNATNTTVPSGVSIGVNTVGGSVGSGLDFRQSGQINIVVNPVSLPGNLGTPDLGFRRTGAGALEFNNGTAGGGSIAVTVKGSVTGTDFNGGTWQGKSLTLANSFTTSGNFAVTQTYTGTTNVTFPTSGTLLTNPVNLATQVTGNLSVNNLNSGTNADSSHFWRGDGTWATLGVGGTVTSVSWTGGLVSIATPTTTPAFTIAGTSGGIPYFSSSTTWASSAALTANAVVLGGGAAASPTVVSGLGTSGQILTSNGAGSAPTWQSAGAGGTVTSIATTSPISGGTITTTGTLSLLVNVDFAFTHSQTITTAPAANTSNDGLILTDTTAASAGNQQFSPRLRLTGQGWKTTATAASQTVDWILENQPVQGSANPTSNLVISSQINAAGYNAVGSWSSLGDLTLTPQAGAGATLTLTGATETTSNPLVSATQTWNASGVTFIGANMNITPTAQHDGSAISRWQEGGTTVATIGGRKSGAWYGVTTGYSFPILAGVDTDGVTNPSVALDGNNLRISMVSGGMIGFSSSASDAYNNAPDTRIVRDAANTMAHRNGTNAQIVSIYNTFTSTTSFERLMLDWATTANVAMLYTQKGSGGGTARVLQMNYGGTTTSAISVPITSGNVTFGGGIITNDATLHHTNTALTNGAGASTATFTNAPSAGNPTKWIPIDDNGTTRYLPAF